MDDTYERMKKILHLKEMTNTMKSWEMNLRNS